MNRNTPRILFVYEFLGLGGVEVVLQSRLAALAEAGLDARALFLAGGAGHSLMTGLTDQVTVSSEESDWAALLESFQPDWVSAIDTPRILPFVRRHSPSSRLIYEVHTPYAAAQQPLLDHDALAGVEALFVPSPSQRDLVRGLTADRWPILIVPNALPSTFHPAERGRFSAPAHPVIGWVGRLDPLKNWKGFIDVAAELRALDIHFWMVGGEQSSAVAQESFHRALAGARLESRLTWYPRVSREEMPSFYRALSQSGGCLLSTSWAESFGMTVLEAAACGCPVVVPDVVGLRDLVRHRRTGLVYPPVEPAAAAEAVRTLLSSPALGATLVKGATRQLAAFSSAAATKALREALIKLTDGSVERSPARPTPVSARQEQLIQAAAAATEEIAYRDEQIRSLQASLEEGVVTRDAVIRALQEELREKVGDRDATIVSLQQEMQEKIIARDEIVAGLQAELHSKVSSANDVIATLQADLAAARLDLSQTTAERGHLLLEAEARRHKELYARDEQMLQLRQEMQTTVSDLQNRVRELDASLKEQRLLHDLRMRETEVEHARALMEAERHLEKAVASREAEAAFLRDQMEKVRLELAQAPRPEDLERKQHEVETLMRAAAELEAVQRTLEEELLAARRTLEEERRAFQQALDDERLAAIRMREETDRGVQARLSDLHQQIERAGAAAAAEHAGRVAAEELTAALRAGHDELHQQMESLREDLAGAHRALRDQEILTDEIRESLRAEAGSVRLRLSNTQFELGMTRQELLAIYRSRLWKLGSAYWKWLQTFGRLPRIAGNSTQDGWQHLPVACPSCGDTIKLLDLIMATPASSTAEEAPATVTAAGLAANVVPIFPDAPVAPLAADSKHDIVCFPIIDWDFRFQRPQQLMLRYARAGHRVFYISQRFRPSGRAFEIRRITESIYEVSLKAPKKNIYSATMSRKDIDEFFDSLDALRKEAGIHAAAAIVELPFWAPLAKRARTEFAWPLIYDCMDHHQGFSGATREGVHEEKKLMRAADLVIVSSAALESTARQHTEKVLLVRNGCDYEHFSGILPKPRMVRPVIGYYGAIADWFDSDLVADLALSRPDWDFVLVGSSHLADLKRLETLPNVRFTGEKSYAEIPSWLASFDVAMIPFKRTPLTEATNPVKCYEMLAGGKPVVAVPIPEVAQLAPFVRLAGSAAEFEREIIAALGEDSEEKAEERQRFARANTWEARFAVMQPAVQEAFPKASIVVVTYNNLELNRECLRSLYARTEWPRFEVFVVDNASTDGTPEFLQEAEQAYPDLTVLLNSQNAGFPAANNQALKRCTGDYLVLLNNDTVVARGWLSTLIRHLHRDPKIGLIGPSTNAIGNEGMVEVGYPSVEQMPAWAAQFVRKHDGEVFDIPMLAMFCVATRRSTFERVGPLDENFGMGMFEDDDYSQRMRELKLRVACARDSFVHHWMRAAFSKVPQIEYDAVFAENRKYFEKKWGRRWEPHQRAKN
jgi:glycosyltransferase involved in cell wall biosynthesis/GT2 family glycosyltransferase